MKQSIVFLLLVASVCMFSGCNTVQGFGKDVEKVGEKIEKSAK
jgi:predicted small secreted protein